MANSLLEARPASVPRGNEEQPQSARSPCLPGGRGGDNVPEEGERGSSVSKAKGEASLNFIKTSFLTQPLLPGLVPQRVWLLAPRKSHPPPKTPLHQHLNHAAKSLLCHNMLWTLSAPRAACGSGQALREKLGVQAVAPHWTSQSPQCYFQTPQEHPMRRPAQAVWEPHSTAY